MLHDTETFRGNLSARFLDNSNFLNELFEFRGDTYAYMKNDPVVLERPNFGKSNSGSDISVGTDQAVRWAHMSKKK